MEVYKKKHFLIKNIALTLRDETEWIELVSNKVNFLVGANEFKIFSNLIISHKNNPDFNCDELYGRGNISKKIIESIINY